MGNYIIKIKDLFMGFAGTSKGSFFEAPEWVNTKIPPGHTSQGKVYPPNYLKSVLSLEFFVWSPNLVWFLIAIFDYVFFPYNITKSDTQKFEWLTLRLLINV